MTLEIRPVLDRADVQEFHDVGERLYRCTPMRTRDVRNLIDPTQPFFRRAEGQAFLALEKKRVIGRIFACVDHRRCEDKTGLVGLYECEDNPIAGATLLKVAEDWLRVRGCQKVLGPLDPTAVINGGLMTSGFDRTNPEATSPGLPYYPKHWLDAGWKSHIELFSWEFGRIPLPKQVRQIAQVVEQRKDLTVRRLDESHFERELDLITIIYNAGWASTWGFVPADREDLRRMLEDKIDFELSRFAFMDGRPAAMALVMLNRTPPQNLGRRERLMFMLTRPTSFRMALFGVVPEYRGHTVGGLAIHLYVLIQHAAKQLGYAAGEATYTSSLDEIPNSGMALMGATRHHVYTVFERHLS